MFYVLNWFVVTILLALWSLAAWAFHSIAAWTAANAEVLASSSGAAEAMRAPDWLAPWFPPELAEAITSVLPALAPPIETILHWVPDLTGGLPMLVWVIWAVGSALLIVLGLLLSGTIAVLRRQTSRGST